MGQILLVVVAVAVSVVTAGAALAAIGGATLGSSIGTVLAGGLIGGLGGGAAGVAGAVAIGAGAGALGSIVSQGVGVATGIQEKFSWKAVGLAAIGGGVGAGLGESFNGLKKIGGAIARGAAGSVISQGVGIATGLQSKFSWTAVAAAGVGAGVGSFVGGEISGKLGSKFAEGLIASGAGAIANAATRSAIDGTNFGDNIIAAIPDVIGQALGNAIAGGIGGALARPKSGTLASLLQGGNQNGSKSAQKLAEVLENLSAKAGDSRSKKFKFLGNNYTQAEVAKAVTAQINSGGNAQISPDIAKYLVHLKENVEAYAAETIATGGVLSDDFRTQKLAFDLTLLNTDIYLDTSVPGLLPTGISRLTDSQVTATYGDGLNLRDSESGYFAAIYRDTNRGTDIYVNRGSGTNPWDSGNWIANFDQDNGLVSAQYKQAIENAKYLEKNYGDRNLLFSGHSLGGGLAAAQAQITGRMAYIFNASGLHINTLTRNDSSFKNIKNSVISYNVEGDGLSFLQDKLLPGLKNDIANARDAGVVQRIIADELMGYLPPGNPARGTRYTVPSVELGEWFGGNEYEGFDPSYEAFKKSFAKSTAQGLAKKVLAPTFRTPGGGGNPFVSSLLDLHGIQYVSTGLVKQMGIF